MTSTREPGLARFQAVLRHSKSYLCEAEFEGWEIDYELLEKRDYAGLVAHYEAVVEWESGSRNSLHKLGEAYVLHGEPEKAIELLSEPHRKAPGDKEFQHVILDALFALGNLTEAASFYKAATSADASHQRALAGQVSTAFLAPPSPSMSSSSRWRPNSAPS